MFGMVADRAGRGRWLSNPLELLWGLVPIGMPFPLYTNLPGVPTPPRNHPHFAFIKFTASDAYNTGKLGSESVSGSAPLVVATATITDPKSPMRGASVNLINSEKRALRASTSAGTVENDQFQGHSMASSLGAALFTNPGAGAIFYGASGAGAATLWAVTPTTDGTNGTPRYGTETRGKNLQQTYFMRIR